MLEASLIGALANSSPADASANSMHSHMAAAFCGLMLFPKPIEGRGRWPDGRPTCAPVAAATLV
jgi:hypothetical protein